MFFYQRSTSLQFHDEHLIHNQIRNKVTQHSAIFISNSQWNLLVYMVPNFSQAMCQAVFVDFLHMPVLQILM